ncbi:hypothetical protein SK128_014785 [Halocaridina rubra]|uniref:Fibrinogen C-terminal domain-containing protein n=1 Tax=Halocaridina rubra TaxID=373956 RepID=A0AAN8XBA7_HALRR
MTRPEDVVAEYDFHVFKEVFLNTTRQLLKTLAHLQNSSAKSESMTEIKNDIHAMTEFFERLSQDTNSLKESVHYGTEVTKQELSIFKDELVDKLDVLQQYIESRSRSIDETVSKLRDMSVNLVAGDCQDLFEMGFNASGVYYLQKFGRQVLCDMETDEGGWLVIQRRARVAEQVDFNQSWQEYKSGFGDLESEFWAGNDFLHIFTNQKSYRLRVDFTDYEKGAYWAHYSTFRVGSESSGYELDLGTYSGNATDAFSYHHGRPFTSSDKDNDLYSEGNCATYFSGAWWYDRCYDAHLNGVYPVVPDRQNASFITWWAHEEGRKVPLVLTEVTIKVKPNKP